MFNPLLHPLHTERLVGTGMRVPNRLPPYTNKCKRLPPKIPNPLPKTAGAPIALGHGCTFYDLTARATDAQSSAVNSEGGGPLLLRSTVGRILSQEQVEEMRRRRLADPNRWTITALAKEYTINRSFIIKNVVSREDQALEVAELAARIDSLSLKQKRGWQMRCKIREHRRDII